MLTRYFVKPRSPVITPLMSDTFFGHFCWAMRYRHGEKFLERLLDSYGKGNPAPVLFSCGFPGGFLPLPVLPPPEREDIDAFARLYVEKRMRTEQLSQGQKLLLAYQEAKALLKSSYVSLDCWTKLKEKWSWPSFLQYLSQNFNGAGNLDGPFSTLEICAGNSIDRSTGTVSEESGELFERDKLWYPAGKGLHLYVEVNDDGLEEQVEWFLLDFLTVTGFGKDKSVGMGWFAIERDKDFDPESLQVKNANARLALSMTSFEGMAGYRSFYRLTTKFGRLGGDFALWGPGGGPPKPFKKPVLMLEPGAVFFTNEALNTKELLGGIHTDQRIRHCGVPLTIPVYIDQEF